MKVLVIGKGGREHALAWKINQSPLVEKVFVAPGNPGIEEFGVNVNIKDNDIEGLVNFALEEKIDLTVVGPETTLALGVADAFEEKGLKIFGPKKDVARLESSKDFAKKIMEKYNVPTGAYKTFDNKKDALEYVNKKGAPIVIKEDGLKAGKGVTVAMKIEEAYEALDIAFDIPGNRVVIEDYLDGFEFSLIALAHNDKVIPLEIGQDHKRVFDGDKGPNTGGMGVYSPVKRVTKDIIEASVNEIIRPTLKGLVEEGLPFTGFIFAGIMDTKDGVKTIEFNARFGDPEAEAILPRMESDLVQLILDIMDNKETPVEWKETTTCGVVMASEGYPASSTSNAEIIISNDIKSQIFHMGTKIENGKLLTNGGRVLIVVGEGKNLQEAMKNAYDDVEKIKCEKLFFRRDIGAKDMI
ncbi:MAG: phosphoribosylamine--glycine ligase [Fusobacterium perfoetens]|uniref:phosphoribosylamine--glycine ligase n=1 Tax=Fusobacterium perfoetens TaxID=852 RepID=UPI0023EFAF08|nr:phosphoribosylamine--glycine ligase [Fusobacterium perfoetens]MCI6152753.1 phosphoribosylamine--glycine ligase [Fusobacterium perfoetens]MDY3236647.1 phosphoribosylamine--glycine ligase [Fusobacterium perfoetens]